MDNVAALGLQCSRFYQDFESGLGAETRHAFGEAEFGDRVHPAFVRRPSYARIVALAIHRAAVANDIPIIFL